MAQTHSHACGLKTLQLNDQKAGMKGFNKELINHLIYETSRGTPYFTFQVKRQKSIDLKIQELQTELNKIAEQDRKKCIAKMDDFQVSLEAERDLSHSIVHIDMDAFYAAVEMEDNPSLKGKPMAVGSLSMLSTSNYEARKYGVRAAMPGFIARKLCPDLIIVPYNFAKYRKVSDDVRATVQVYDPDYCTEGLDEMYLDLTKYINEKFKADPCLEKDSCSRLPSPQERDEMAYNIVTEIREKIHSVTHLTASAGIAPNVMLAKVCSDQNKPNGQFQISSTKEAVMKFVSTLAVRKVSGIGPVQGQILSSIGINTCSDMWDKRDVIPILFKPSSADFYIRVALGIGSTTVKSEHVRKSIGVEQTFREMRKTEELHRKCQELCEEAVDDLQLQNMVGKVIVLKYKTTDFESHTRNLSLCYYTANKDVVNKAAKRLLDSEINRIAPRPLKLRLMGIRISNLMYLDKVPNQERNVARINDYLSQEGKSGSKCPVCGREPSVTSLLKFNAHLDQCLSKVAIKQMLTEDGIEKKRKQQHMDQKVTKKIKFINKTEKKIEDYFCKTTL